MFYVANYHCPFIITENRHQSYRSLLPHFEYLQNDKFTCLIVSEIFIYILASCNIMAEPIQKKIKRSIAASEGAYHRLILLVGESGSGKTKALNDLSLEIGVEVINLNLLLSKQLLEMTPKQRSLQLAKIIEDTIRGEGDTVILDNIELLFDNSLKQDPLRLLQMISRNKTIISSWSGKQDQSKLLYAEAGHPEYRTYDITDLLIVNMDGSSNLDLQPNQER